MRLELYFHKDCGFSRSVLSTITNLKIEDKVEHKDIRENLDYETELVKLMGDAKVPTLVVDGKPQRESEDIKKFLVAEFL